ncbi:hypothetical protein ACLBWX_17635 [Methylobacterium sp. M6A4_1b]
MPRRDRLDLAGSTAHVTCPPPDLMKLIEIRARILPIRTIARLMSLSGFDPRNLSPEPAVEQ